MKTSLTRIISIATRFAVISSIVFAFISCKESGSGAESESTSENAGTHFYDGFRLYQAKKYKLAQPFFVKAVQSDPDFAAAYIYWWKAYSAEGNFTAKRPIQLKKVLEYGEDFLCPEGIGTTVDAPIHTVKESKSVVILFCGYLDQRTPHSPYPRLEMSEFNLWVYDRDKKTQKNIFEASANEDYVLHQDWPSPTSTGVVLYRVFWKPKSVIEIKKRYTLECKEGDCKVVADKKCEFRKDPKSYLSEIKKDRHHHSDVLAECYK